MFLIFFIILAENIILMRGCKQCQVSTRFKCQRHYHKSYRIIAPVTQTYFCSISQGELFNIIHNSAVLKMIFNPVLYPVPLLLPMEV